MVWGCTKIPGGECHRHGKGIWKRDNEVWTLHNILDFWHGCQWMCRQTMVVLLCMHSGFPAERLEQMIVTSLYDVTRVSCATVGRNYKRRAWLSLGAAVTVIWVFQHKRLGLWQATDPLLWLSWCPLSRKHIQNAQCCLFFNKHASRPILRTLSYLWLYLSDGSQADHYLLPWNVVSSKAQITTLQ